MSPKVLSVLSRGLDRVAGVVRPLATRVILQQCTDIRLERNRRALASTVDFVEKNMPFVAPSDSKYDLIASAFRRAEVRPHDMICEFGVFTGSTINHIAGLTSNTVYGFDSFEGLPEAWDGTGIKKGHFALDRLPPVRENVKLIKGWFNESLPPFLERNPKSVGFLHVDCDLYSSTKVVFDLLGSRLRPGAVIVFDEYFNYAGWEHGEHKAFTEFLEHSARRCRFIGYHGKSQQVAAVLE